ncbi:MAG: NAD(P)/FAD-dependent oxidoreductase [Microcoleaceae cyanobacterium]
MLDYDLVIIGGTITGIYAAITATQLQGRVALIQPSPTTGGEDTQKSGSTDRDEQPSATTTQSPTAERLDPPISSVCTNNQGFRHNKIISQIGKLAEQVRHKEQFGIYQDSDRSGNVSVKFEQAQKYADYVVSNQLAKYEPAVLAALGIDVIFGDGKFVSQPHLAFVVKGRHLRSRTYLLAVPSQPIIPPIPGLTTTGFITAETIKNLSKLPQTLVVIGGDPSGTEIAQTFARLGTKVTMVVKNNHILAKEDSEAAFLLQAQLEAEGVRILTQTEVSQAREIDEQKWVLVGNEAIETDEILLAAGNKANLKTLNLEAVGVKFDPRGLLLNQKLQTTNPRIYACGDLAGGYSFPHIANYEAQVALKNILYLPIFNVNYNGIPWAIGCDPQIARVGLTEAQARQRYREDIFVFRQHFKNIDQAHILDETTGFCKFIARKNGEILGVSIVGTQASEIVHIMALAIRQGIKMEAIAELPHIWPTISEINAQTALAWLSQRRERNQMIKNFLENLFHWRRSWS